MNRDHNHARQPGQSPWYPVEVQPFAHKAPTLLNHTITRIPSGAAPQYDCRCRGYRCADIDLTLMLCIRHSNHAPAGTSDKRPIWDFQKVLGQWAEERDITRDLLNQHTNWIDNIQRELAPK